MVMMKTVCTMLLASGLALVLAACSIMPRAEPVTIDRYTLEAPAWPVREADVDAPVLLVNRPMARIDLDTTRMAYREQDYQLRYFARSRWADTPAQLLLPGLVEALEASGQFGAVVRVGSAARAGLRLDADLLEFSQDFRDGSGEFQLRLRLQLMDLETRAVLASRIFTTRAAAPERSPRGVAHAANAAWQTLLPELVAFTSAASASYTNR
jgi:cholesterol transport system auxiliary component